MPKLWEATVDAHRQAVRDATIDTTAALVAEQGLRGVTMSRIAEQTGIGRATLYKYFADVESILAAWHERTVAGHLHELGTLARGDGALPVRLEAVLAAFAANQHEQPGGELAALLHQGAHVAHARNHLSTILRGLLQDGVEAGEVRDDVPVAELASYCIHSLAAARDLPSKAAVRRLVGVTLDALKPR